MENKINFNYSEEEILAAGALLELQSAAPLLEDEPAAGSSGIQEEKFDGFSSCADTEQDTLENSTPRYKRRISRSLRNRTKRVKCVVYCQPGPSGAPRRNLKSNKRVLQELPKTLKPADHSDSNDSDDAIQPAPMELLEPIEVDESEDKENKTNNNTTTEMVPIGSGRTLVPRAVFRKLKWASYTVATRSLLLALFSRSILATHSLTGKKSPAFLDKPAKACLDPQIVADIILEITLRFDVTNSMVRTVITTKCADECKMMKMRQNRHPPDDDHMPP